MDSLPKLGTALPDRRPRPGPGPDAARLRELREAIASGTYRVAPERIAAALISSTGPPAPRD
jgi:hypothetical protein